jgi:PAS domain S-box-containing protein
VLHEGLARVGIVWQEAILLMVAVFVGLRVDHERLAQAEAQARDDARRVADARYRTLFDQAAEAVLVVGSDSRVEEANSAAGRLLGRPSDEIVGVDIGELAGGEIAAEIGRSSRTTRPLALRVDSTDQSVWVEVLASGPLLDRGGRSHTQVILHDVTLLTERQQGLEEYARRTVRTREEERRRIGRELHDGPLQSLMLLLRELDSVEAPAEPEPTPDPIVDARDLAEQTADELRRISRALRPSILDDLGLVPAIRSEAAALARRAGLKVGFASSGSQSAMAPEVELVLLRVAQEALHNVERHAAASTAMVRLRFGPRQTCLIIRDDGQGLDQSASASALLSAGKLGLVGMEERTRLVGGDFAARSRLAGGTLIVSTVPSAARSRAIGDATAGPTAVLD